MADIAADSSNLIADLLGKAGNLMSQDFVIPTYRGVGTGKAEAEVNKARKSRDELSATAGASTATSARATEELKSAERASGQAGADMAYANQAQAEAYAHNEQFTNQLFGIENTGSGEMAILAKENVEGQDKLRALKPVLDRELNTIKEMQSVGPLDNPLEWLVNGLQLPSKISDYNASSHQYNNEAARIEQQQTRINAQLENSAAMAARLNKGIPTISAAQAKATADKAIQEANKLAAQADMQFAMHSLDFANKKLAGDLAISGQTINMTEMQIREATTKYQSQINAINLADTHAKRLLEAAKVYEAMDDINTQKTVLRNAELTLGYEPGSLTPASLKGMKKDVSDAIKSIGLTNSLGVTALDAAETMKLVKFGKGASPDTIKVANYIQEKLGSLETTLMKDMQFKSKTPEERRAILNSGLTHSIEAEMLMAEKPGNFFHELSPAKMMMADKEFAQSQLGKILSPLAAKDQEIMTKDVAATILEAVGNNASNAGAALSGYYKDNIETRNKAIPYAKIGAIPTPVSYIVHNRGAAFDMTKPGDATKYVISLQLDKQQSGFPGIGGVVQRNE